MSEKMMGELLTGLLLQWNSTLEECCSECISVAVDHVKKSHKLIQCTSTSSAEWHSLFNPPRIYWYCKSMTVITTNDL